MSDITTIEYVEDATEVLINTDLSIGVFGEATVLVMEDGERTVVLVEQDTFVVSGEETTTVLIQESTTIVTTDTAGPQGPAGPAADADEDLTLTYDVDGKLIVVDGETKYIELTYDVDGKLIEVLDTVSGITKTLGYNVDDQLVSVTVTP
jgi:YD repeat-containing protein